MADADPFIDEQYRNLALEVLRHGTRTKSRAGETLSVFAPTRRIHFRGTRRGNDEAPLLTTKPLNISAIGKELAWFVAGRTNTADLQCKIWDEWARPDGDCGPIYGVQWRGLGASQVDQLRDAIHAVRASNSRRAVVSAWQPSDLKDMALPPCHTLFQLASDYVHDCLHLQMYQRSADIALGVPFNILSYWLLQTLIARHLGLAVGNLTIVYGDAHVYTDHADDLRAQLSRVPYENGISIDTYAAQDPFDALIRDVRDQDAFVALRYALSTLTPIDVNRCAYRCAYPAVKYAVAV